jgi:O-antigen/teichoic acid export membrane protein
MVIIDRILRKVGWRFNNSLFGRATTYTLSNFAVAAIPFFLLPVLTRVLDPAAYGTVAMFSMVLAFFSVGVGLNVNGAISVRYFDKATFDIPKYVSTALGIIVLSTAMMLVLVFAAGDIIAEYTSVPKKWHYAAVAVAFFQLIAQILLTLWQASNNVARYGMLKILHAMLDAIGSIVLVVVFVLSWQGRLSGMIIASLCAAIIAIYFLIRDGWLAKSIDYCYAKDALGYGIPLIPHALGGLLLVMADRFMVSNLLDVASTGIYVVAIQLSLVLGLFADSYNKAFAPWLMEKLGQSDFELRRRIVILTYKYFISILLVAFFAGYLAPYGLPLLVGQKYQSSGPILVYILLGNAFTGMYYMVTNYIFYRGRTGLLSALTTSVGTIALGVTWVLIQSYGITGAAIGYMFGQALLFIGAWILAQKCFPMPWFDALLVSKDISERGN